MPDIAPTFPPPAASSGHAWATLPPEQAGLDAAALATATAFAAAHETPWPRDLRALMARGHFDPPPFNRPVGPVHPRGPTNGLVLRHGPASPPGATRARSTRPSAWRRATSACSPASPGVTS